MGLDMYLKRFPKEINIDIEEEREKFLYQQATVYWRKANAVHAWFVRNVQEDKDECKIARVPFDKLIELMNICKEIIYDWSKASKLLPTKDGFYFGNVDYSDDYKDDILMTYCELRSIYLSKGSQNDFFYYRSSW